MIDTKTQVERNLERLMTEIWDKRENYLSIRNSGNGDSFTDGYIEALEHLIGLYNELPVTVPEMPANAQVNPSMRLIE